ncbi:transposase [Myxococcus sp. CA040A]|uniref:transposase n=1 Tax=Myxococcus sp. CA040A TaxID=2741738 RepID=UPI00157BB35D|nr:transposase [Myxococcus sp. CA040A]NTX08961.1 transposase [Myxococcus sp. CA040A]
MKAGQWCITKDEEEWMDASAFDTKEDAIARAPVELALRPGLTFWVGVAVQAPSALNAALVVDALDNHASDEAPDGSDGYDISDEARTELDVLLTGWATKHAVKPTWFDIGDVSEHVVPAETLHLFTDDDGNTYAARDLAHAKDLWVADTGQPIEDAGDWRSIPDDKAVTVNDDGVKSTKTAAEWAAEMSAPGCCFSSNY